jgi:CRISPR/Cas system CSM-associated protein Csm2 small subunit
MNNVNVIEEFFNSQVSFRDIGKIIERIHQEHEKLCNITSGQKEKQIRKIAKQIRNEICECNHPVVKKMLDWGYLKGRTEYGRILEQNIWNLLDKGIKSSEDIEELREKIEEFKRFMMKDVEKIVKGEWRRS